MTARCPKCRKSWEGTWPKGFSERCCIWCGHTFTTKVVVKEVEVIEDAD